MPQQKTNNSNDISKIMTNCIVVKFHDDMNIPYTSDEEMMKYLADHFHMPWASINEKFPGIAVRRLIRSITPDQLNELMHDAEHGSKNLYNKDYKAPKFYNFFKVICPSNIAKDELLKLIQNLTGVEYAYIQKRSVPAGVTPTRQSLASKQRYLNPAPLGIDAKFAWTMPGGKGESASLNFIHIEEGWSAHNDLQAWASIDPIRPLSGANNSTSGHGTNVLGIIIAQNNRYGINGITPAVNAGVVSQYASNNPDDENPADAITFAAHQLKAGDVMLITLQGYDETGDMMPAEFDKAVFECIRLGTMKGVVIIEVAGNNALDLSNHAMFDENQPLHYKDSGAIIVGAAESRVTHKRLQDSNFGSRVNCFAWGEKITTTDRNNGYIFDFGKTCGAATIIAGAAISIQSMYLAKKNKTFNCEEMRRILSNNANGTASPDPIGIMPDLKKIYENYIK